MSDLKELLLDNPIIASVKNDNNLDEVLSTDVKIVFVLYGNLMNIGEIAEKLRKNNKKFFIHIEMIEGLKSDETGILYLKKYANPLGIISTKQMHIKLAKKHSLYTILRMFVIDSMSLDTAIKNTEEYKPMAIEILPGTSKKIIQNVNKNVNIPVIASGLIVDKEDVINALEAGAVAISTTSNKVWRM